MVKMSSQADYEPASRFDERLARDCVRTAAAVSRGLGGLEVVALSASEIAKLVQDCLKSKPPEGPRVRVDASDVRPGGDSADWWYVPVSYYPGDGREWAYYEMFSEIEEQLESQHEVNVLLVPRRLAGVDPNAPTV